MILTRSIRRKLVIQLALVFTMLLLLSIASFSAIRTYWSLIDELRFSRDEEPQQADLLNAMVGLNDPLIASIPVKEYAFQSGLDPRFPENSTRSEGAPQTNSAKRIQQTPGSEVSSKAIEGDLPAEEQKSMFDQPQFSKELWEYTWEHNLNRLELDFRGEDWKKRWKKAHDELAEFRRRFVKRHKIGSQQRILSDPILDSMSSRLNFVEWRRTSAETLYPQLIRAMLLDVAELERLVRNIPIDKTVLESALRGSDYAIQWRLWLIACPTAIVLGLFFSLTYFGYHWILIPIRKLHEAAARVANGDFTYRLKLRGKDEMVELAEMFNKMTERFQTDKARLAQEVEERSRQILRNERLAGIGFFASGISHEINNPLQAIGAAAESLTSRMGDGSLGGELPTEDRELLATYLGMIEREANRCQQITSRVLDFARGTNGPKSRQDLTKIVSEVLDMISHMSKFDNCKIVFDRSQPHLIDVSAAEMKQVILNLVANGLESMNGSGTLSLQITEMVDEVVLSVQDEGCGMTAAVIANLYEPFFTEKQNGKGTGLGLSITHRIVGDHGGRIEATSEGPGCGSTFRVHLPRCANPANLSAA